RIVKKALFGKQTGNRKSPENHQWCFLLGLISTLIITIKKDKEKYFGEKSCSSEGVLKLSTQV
ncbi:MAG TPA: hypothetical protein QF571_06005, partial [Desulfobacterales bacterium]|nr:hypothetical protein [Desulfobacterales bacterium]